MKARATLNQKRLAPVLAFTLSTWTVLLAGCSSKPAPMPQAPTEETEPEEVDRRYAALPEPLPTPQWAPPEVKKRSLENGVHVWNLEQDSIPLVSLHLILPLGSASDPEDKQGLTLLTADLLDEGAGDLTALEISERLGQLATDYDAQTGVDYVLLSMNALAENLEPSVALLADIVQRPRFSYAEFDRRREHHQAVALASRADPKSRLATALDRVLFGRGYAGSPARGTEESLKRIRLADVKRHARSLTVPEGSHLVFAGAVDEEEAVRLTGKYFGDWAGKKPRPEHEQGEAAAPGRAYVVNFPGAAQSALAIAKLAGPSDDPRYFSEKVMNEKLGGTFTSRINLNLREDKGYTYGAFSRFQRFREAGYFAVQASVLTETTAASVREVFQELSSLCEERPLTAEEHRDAVAGLLLGYPTQFAQVDSLGMRVASLPIYERPSDFWTTWPDEIESIGLEEANRAAEPYCNPDDYRVVVAGDLLAIQPGLEELGLEVVELDRDGFPAEKEASAKP